MFRLGFACKYMHNNRSLSKKEIETIERTFNTRTVTAKWMSSVHLDIATERIYEVVEHNLNSIQNSLRYVTTLDSALHMYRISSDILPLYSHPKWKFIYTLSEFKDLMESKFSIIGQFARTNNIRLSFHPGQFCVLASHSDDIVKKSIEEFEYHADMARMMGYGVSFQDFKCNVHISGASGPEGIRAMFNKLSTTAKNIITFENEEKKYGLNSVLETSDLAPVVLDIHHCWINENDYIDIKDDRIKKVIDSWRGVRPTMHYSQSKEFLQDLGFNKTDKLKIPELLKVVNKKDLYAHSDYMWNDWSNLYAKQFLENFDIMFEVKSKNLAVIEYYNTYLS